MRCFAVACCAARVARWISLNINTHVDSLHALLGERADVGIAANVEDREPREADEEGLGQAAVREVAVVDGQVLDLPVIPDTDGQLRQRVVA